jgi:hypothetical protein
MHSVVKIISKPKSLVTFGPISKAENNLTKKYYFNPDLSVYRAILNSLSSAVCHSFVISMHLTA